MTTFDDREKAFEDTYQHNQDVLFRARARRDRLAGLWAAKLMGLPKAEADAYARHLVESDVDLRPPAVHTRLLRDLHSKGIDISAHRVERELEHLLRTAHSQIIRE